MQDTDLHEKQAKRKIYYLGKIHYLMRKLYDKVRRNIIIYKR